MKSLFIGNVSCYVAEYMFRVLHLFRYETSVALREKFCVTFFENLFREWNWKKQEVLQRKNSKKRKRKSTVEEKWKKSPKREKRRENRRSKISEGCLKFYPKHLLHQNHTKRKITNWSLVIRYVAFTSINYDKMFVWLSVFAKMLWQKYTSSPLTETLAITDIS